jgi:hypothetical protein
MVKNKTQLAALLQKRVIQGQHQHGHHAAQTHNIRESKHGLTQ